MKLSPASVFAALCVGFGAPVAGEEPMENEKAVFGAGCFWCVEAVYEAQPGVVTVVSGYAGGKEPNPTYDQVSSGRTSHAEVVEVEFDPAVVSYEQLVDLFWDTHDPTDPRGVWPDFGPHYRSTILTANPEQRAIAEKSKATAAGRFEKPIVTEIADLEIFYPAESYHQDFVKGNRGHPYVERIAIPKLEKLGLDAPE